MKYCAQIQNVKMFFFIVKRKKGKILVRSSETHGPYKEVIKISNSKITISKLGNAESLNVASASSVLLAELTK